MLRSLVLGVLLFYFPVLFRGSGPGTDGRNAGGTFSRGMKSRATESFDVKYYRLNLRVTANPQYLQGDVTITGVCTRSLAAPLVFDLRQSMRVDSVKIDGAPESFTQDSTSLSINFSPEFAQGSGITARIYYQGTPEATGFGSFVFSSHSGVPWIWSLSEPYGAMDWWPCKDHPYDKADSADIYVTCDSSFRVGSNGRLVSVAANGDGTKTHHWAERYPIASYLISVALTNYVQFSDWYKYSADSLEILNYVIPEHYDLARSQLSVTAGMLDIFSGMFGAYPFLKEKD